MSNINQNQESHIAQFFQKQYAMIQTKRNDNIE